MEQYFIRVNYSPAPESAVIEIYKTNRAVFSDSFSIKVVDNGAFCISSNSLNDLYRAGMVGGSIADFYPLGCEQPADAQQEQSFDNARTW